MKRLMCVKRFIEERITITISRITSYIHHYTLVTEKSLYTCYGNSHLLDHLCQMSCMMRVHNQPWHLCICFRRDSFSQYFFWLSIEVDQAYSAACSRKRYWKTHKQMQLVQGMITVQLRVLQHWVKKIQALLQQSAVSRHIWNKLRFITDC